MERASADTPGIEAHVPQGVSRYRIVHERVGLTDALAAVVRGITESTTKGAMRERQAHDGL